MTTAGWRMLPTELDGIVLSHRMRGHYAEGEVPVLMIHGIGPGTTGEANFAPLLNRLPPRFAPHLIDLAGFGQSGRLVRSPFFDVSFWLRQIALAIGRATEIHGCPPFLIGNSVGAVLALKAAAASPGVKQVLAIGAPAGPPAPPELRAFWTAPRDAEALAAAMCPMTGAARAPDPALVEARLRPFLDGDYGDYFATMLADPDDCLRAVALARPEAAALTSKVALMHGRLDRACPVSALLNELLPLIPNADVTLLGGCGHNVIYERTADVITTIERLSERVDLL